MTICCLNPDCPNPLNPDNTRFCLTCSTPLVTLLRNRFQVMRVLSDEGGFGRTYLAEDVDKLSELCVIKQLAPKAEGSWALKKAIELFQKEAQRLQQLGENPQIPTLIAYFEQDSYLYLVQQYIDGQNLLRELNLRRQGKALHPYSEAEIRKILLDLLPILKFIHEHGVIHRDIKPQNIVRRQSDGRLNLIDFGSSKQLTARVQSKIGTSIGSHGYSPIEQIRDGAAYPASDLFSLGATAFHLLTGISPFKLWTEHGYAWVSGWRKYLKVQVKEEFAIVLDKLLKKDKNQRYQSADEVIQDLSRGLHPSERLFPVGTSQQLTSLSSSPYGDIKLQIIIVGVAGVLLLIVGNFWYKQFYIDGSIPANLSQPNRTSTNRHLNTEYNHADGTDDATVDSQKSVMPNFTLAVTVRGYASSVLSIAVSPDGNTVASTNNDTIQLWSLTTGQAISTLFGHQNRVNAIAINPNGKILASGSDDNTVKLWNLDNGQQIRTLIGHRAAITTVAMSPDGQILASGSDDKTIKLWNLVTREEIRTIRGYTATVKTVAFSPDSKILATGSFETIKLWNIDTGREINTFAGDGEIRTIAFSPDGKYLASGSKNTIKIWNLKTGEHIHSLEGHTGEITNVAFSPDGMILVSSSHDSTIKLWDYTTAKNIRTLAKHGDGVETFAFSLDGKTIVSGGADRTLRVWRQP
jgi:WD40 repeat protein/tRNA A-37 threonylcarbamoyl transferase component Bud32